VGKAVILCTAFENFLGSQATKNVNITFHEENNAADVEFPMKISAKSLCLSLQNYDHLLQNRYNHSSMEVSDNVP